MFNFVSQSVTDYCERVGELFLSEPLNLVSSLAFFVSALLVYKLYKNKKVTGFGYWPLFYLLILIGIGSSLWHCFRNSYTLALDAMPVFIFLLLFIYLLLRKLLNSSFKAFMFVVAFFLFQVGVSYLFPQILNGSVRHVVNAVVFITLGSLIYKRNPLLRKDIVLALSLYAFAIIFRSIDNQVCLSFPVGTHFLWHILNATASYFAIKILLNVKPLVTK